MYDEPETNKVREEERFELLSAYIDGEVTPAERQQVQQWLDTDPKFHKLYLNLLKLQNRVQNIPVPPSEKSAKQLSEGVFQEIDRRKLRSQMVVWGGGAIAAALVAAFGSLLGNNSPAPQLARYPDPVLQESDLIIALNRPPVEFSDTNEEYLMLPLNRPTIEIPQ